MRAFSCDHCQASIAFESTLCGHCGSPVAYDRRQRTMVVQSQDPLEPLGLRYTDAEGRISRPCAHLDLAHCNWLAELGAVDGLCSSCQLTRTRPANDDPAGLLAFVAAETAKRRLLFQLDELGLPSSPRFGPAGGVAFDLLSSSHDPVAAGYQDGVITIDLGARPEETALPLAASSPTASSLAASSLAASSLMSSAQPAPHGLPPLSTALLSTPASDSAGPTRLRQLREAIGFWYFDLLIDGTEWFDRLLQLTPDERAGDAFAQAWAQYLELRDALETAASFDVTVGGGAPAEAPAASTASTAPTASGPDFDELIARWRPLTAALNALGRSRGDGDQYPTSFSDATLARLRFVHDRLRVR